MHATQNKQKIKYNTYQNANAGQVPVVHAYNPNYLGGQDWEDHSSMSAQDNSSQDPISKITRAKMDWMCGSSGRAPALPE
jgi:hypothetical protein